MQIQSIVRHCTWRANLRIVFLLTIPFIFHFFEEAEGVRRRVDRENFSCADILIGKSISGNCEKPRLSKIPPLWGNAADRVDVFLLKLHNLIFNTVRPKNLASHYFLAAKLLFRKNRHIFLKTKRIWLIFVFGTGKSL